MLEALVRRCSAVAGWLVVVVVATATAIGAVHHFLGPRDVEHHLITAVVADRPVASVAFWGVSLLLWSVVFRGVCRWVARWRHGAPVVAPTSVWGEKIERLTSWIFSRWYRAVLALAVAWSPWILTSYPGQPNPDFSRMLEEFLLQRSWFENGSTTPFEAYPTSHYLLTDDEGLWSNHHNFYLMLYYGAVARVSIGLFDSLMPAIFLLSAVALLFTLVAFGRAFQILGRLVPATRPRVIAFGIVAASPLIALWGMSHTKNHLFAAALVWWIALVAEFVHSPGPIRRRWYVETTLISVGVAVFVLFGWMILVAQAVIMLGVRRGRWVPWLVMAVPGVLVHGTITAAVASGALIPSDPIETKGVQLQQLALTLAERPDALTPEDAAALDKIFDLEVMGQVYDEDVTDPVKSTGPLATKTDSYRYKTVQPEDWEAFNAIWWRTARANPDLYVDALVAKSYRYLDPFDKGTHYYPPWGRDYVRSVGDHPISPVGFNDESRQAVKSVAAVCHWVPGCRPLISHPVRIVALVLICAAAIVVRRRFAWVWAMPFALQVGVMAMSPLSAGGRYALAFTYAIGIMVLLMALDDRQPQSQPPNQPQPQPQNQA